MTHSPASGETFDAVVFDIGNVLFEWDPRHLYAKLIRQQDELDWFLSHVVTHDWHFQLDAGRTLADCTAELIARFPGSRALIEQYGPRWLETIPGPVAGMPQLVEALADAAVPLFAITNFSAEFYPRFAKAHPVMRHFRDVVVSGAEKIVKPDPRIFALASARFGIDPPRSLFIDDRLDNIQSAADAGYQVEHFSGNGAAARLASRLAAAGLIKP